MVDESDANWRARSIPTYGVWLVINCIIIIIIIVLASSMYISMCALSIKYIRIMLCVRCDQLGPIGYMYVAIY